MVFFSGDVFDCPIVGSPSAVRVRCAFTGSAADGLRDGRGLSSIAGAADARSNPSGATIGVFAIITVAALSGTGVSDVASILRVGAPCHFLHAAVPGVILCSLGAVLGGRLPACPNLS